ncbi:MAG: pyridoxal phosphate-dependent aminotransferase [Candidatus Heimdallarchaeota archaeon]|nr:pyridoxal phosphate-dependent aminotransferase [Candidatus Heimdallarchaeota archaeon]MCK5049670.1 pyridoxal phosphate-dependent aminotransferase [Candidatus Heimdallarchaeota archaeon]
MKPSRRISKISPPPIVKLNRAASELQDVISFGQGVPFFTPQSSLFNNFVENFKRQDHIYSADEGIEELRFSLSSFLHDEFHVQYAPSDLILTSGANQAFMNVIFSLLDPGDEIILPSPYYFNQKMAIEMIGGKVKVSQTSNNWQLDLQNIENQITSRTKAIVIVSPNNPTGAIYTHDSLIQLGELAERNNLAIISDETYGLFAFDDSFRSLKSIGSIKDNVITIGSLSKVFGISGWRVGYIGYPEHMLDSFLKAQDTIAICCPTASQKMALELLKDRKKFKENIAKIGNIRKKMILELKQLDPEMTFEATPGAYYFFVNTMAIEKDDNKLAWDLLEKAKVLSIPGSVFGKRGEGYLRLSYGGTDEEKMKEGVNRIKKYIEKR